MLSQWIRVLHSDNGVLTDYSIAAQNSDTIPFQMVATQDYVYVGQYWPFNNLFFHIKTANANASLCQVQYWDGRQWRDAVDVLDGTMVAGKSLARSGVIQYSPDREKRWQDTVDTSEAQGPTELSSVKIYNLYWARFKWSATLSAGTELNSLTYAFCTDEHLRAIDPEINNYLLPWGGATKTDWIEQIMLGSQHVLYSLKERGFVAGPGSILRFDDVALGTAYRVLAIIYSRLGEPFRTQYQDALNAFTQLLSVQRFSFDTNEDAFMDKQEVQNTVSKLVR